MRINRWAVIFIAVILLAGCWGRTSAHSPAQCAAKETRGAPAGAAGNLSWNKKPLADAPADFRFAVVADNTGGLRPGVFRDAIGKLNLLRPAFVLCVGDLIEGYAEDETELKDMWDDFAGDIALLDVPFFGVVGNHDVSNEMMSAYVVRRLGPLYYSFVCNDVLFLILNSQDDPAREDAYRSGLGEAQVDFVAKTLADNSGVRWTFVFMHQPLFVKEDYAEAPGWGKVEEMLASRPHTVFAGHWHRYARHDVNGHVYYRLATTGGDSPLDGAQKGEFDQVVWVTMAGSAPAVANLALDGIYPDDVSTHQTTIAYRSLDPGTVMRPISAVTGERPFTSGNITVEFTNETEFPLAVKSSFVKDDLLVIEPSQIEVSVKPNSTDSVEVSVTAPNPVDPDSLQPIAVEWSARYDVPGRQPIEGSGKSAFVVEGIHPCGKAAGEIKVDGDLSEWSALPERFVMPMEFARNEQFWEGPEDASIAFAAAYDDAFLYLALAVTDDRIVVDAEHRVRQEDALTVLVDARPAADRAAPTAGWDKFICFVLSPAPAPGQEEFGEPLVEGAKAASVIGAPGFNTEIAIPLALLDKAAGGRWQDFRLNVRLHDLDTQDWNTTLMWWRPAWDGKRNYPGSGTFMRQ